MLFGAKTVPIVVAIKGDIMFSSIITTNT